MAHTKNVSLVYYLVALPLVFITLLYTGIIRRFFYALPIACLKLVASRSMARVVAMTSAFCLLLYGRILPIPFTYFIERFESLIEHSILRGSAYTFIDNAELETLPNSFIELGNSGVNFWHVEMIFPVPMIEYWVYFGLFLGALTLSIAIDKLLLR
ncbi:hypothetical protein [Vibrio harveyi]|uniref:hypothetical protein n=1 Tax=Vibrio harveyi TaxID=669 RepID=UPI00247FBF4F|nr:hypothetical protein [Vibrio harveyi]